MNIFSKDLILNQYEWHMQYIPGKWRGACATNGVKQYQIVGKGSYLLSTTGTQWTKYEIPNTSSYYFCSCASPFSTSDLVVGDGLLAIGFFSSNLWNFFTNINGVSWNGSTFGNNKYVAVGSGATVAYANKVNPGQSMTWTVSGSTSGMMLQPQCVKYIEHLDMYIAGGGSAYISYSTNGSSWTSCGQVGTDTSVYWNDIATNGSVVVMIGAKTSGSGVTYIATSTDGINWTVSSPYYSFAGNSIAYHNGQWMIAGYEVNTVNAGKVLESTDLTNWQATSISDSDSFGFYTVIPTHSGWVIAGNDYVGFREY